MLVRFHWLAVTVHLDYESFDDLIYTGFLKQNFGDLTKLDHGGRGYRKISTALLGVQVYWNPISGDDNCHLVLPGSACEAVLPHDMIRLFGFLKDSGIRFNVTRLDLAVDEVPFTVDEFYQSIVDEKLNSLAKRSTLSYIVDPYQENEQGGIGCHSCYLGSRTSERMVRVYDQHGFVRLEFQMTGKRALYVATEFFSTPYPEWFGMALKHIRQYIELDTEFWRDFTSGTIRGDLKITSVRAVSVRKLDDWLMRQASVALFVLHQVSGELYSDDILSEGAARLFAQQMKGPTRYDALLHLR